MGIGTKDIVVAFYLGYWIVHNSKPFSIWWIVGLYIGIFIFETIITSILKKSSKIIKEKALDIDIKIKQFDNRLKMLEDKYYVGGNKS